jgi:hypothetical protein
MRQRPHPPVSDRRLVPWLGRAFRRLARAAGVGVLVAAGTAQAQEPSPQTPTPPSWVSYARRVSQTLAARLTEVTPQAAQARAALAGADTVEVNLWLDEAGRVTRVVFPALPDPRSAADVERLLRSPPPLPPPPAALPFPLRLRLTLARPAPAPAAVAGGLS